jgi:hypothetical protein
MLGWVPLVLVSSSAANRTEYSGVDAWWMQGCSGRCRLLSAPLSRISQPRLALSPAMESTSLVNNVTVAGSRLALGDVSGPELSLVWPNKQTIPRLEPLVWKSLHGRAALARSV